MKFDIEKVIVDPNKLIVGRKYFASLFLRDLKNLVEKGNKNRLNEFLCINLEGVPLNTKFGTATLWYPYEESICTYRPYKEAKFEWGNKKVIDKKNGKTYLVDGISLAVEGGLVHIELHSWENLGDFFLFYTWEDGTPCGEEVYQ